MHDQINNNSDEFLTLCKEIYLSTIFAFDFDLLPYQVLRLFPGFRQLEIKYEYTKQIYGSFSYKLESKIDSLLPEHKAEFFLDTLYLYVSIEEFGHDLKLNKNFIFPS